MTGATRILWAAAAIGLVAAPAHAQFGKIGKGLEVAKKAKQIIDLQGDRIFNSE